MLVTTTGGGIPFYLIILSGGCLMFIVVSVDSLVNRPNHLVNEQENLAVSGQPGDSSGARGRSEVVLFHSDIPPPQLRRQLKQKRRKLRKLRQEVRNLREKLHEKEGIRGESESEHHELPRDESTNNGGGKITESRRNRNPPPGRKNKRPRKGIIHTMRHQYFWLAPKGERKNRKKKKHRKRKNRQHTVSLSPEEAVEQERKVTEEMLKYKMTNLQSSMNHSKRGEKGYACSAHRDCRPGLCCHLVKLSGTSSNESVNDTKKTESAVFKSECTLHALEVGAACRDSCQCASGMHCYASRNGTANGDDGGVCKVAATADFMHGSYLNAKESLFEAEIVELRI